MKKNILLGLMINLLISCTTSMNKPSWFSESTGSIHLRSFDQKILKNGLKVYFIKDNSLPRVSLTLLTKSGLFQESTPGLNAMTAQLLEQGTQKKSANQIADELAAIGSSFNVSPGDDMTVFSADALSVSADSLVKLFSELIQKPSFRDDEIERLRSQTLAFLKRKKDNPSGLVEEYFESQVFNGHPYERNVSGTEQSVREIRKKDIIQHYLSWYRPNNSSLAVVGSFDEAYEKLVTEQMELWPAKVLSPLPLASHKTTSQASPIKLYIKKGLAQTQIRMGIRGIQRNNIDYLTLRLGTEVLGGSFASRLMQRVRDDLGLTYSISASVDARLEPGVFSISTFTKNESVKQTIVEIQKVLKKYLEEGPTSKELQAAKNQLVGQFPRAIETSDRYAYNLLALDFYGVPLNYLTEFNQNVEKIKINDVNRVLKKYFQLDQMRITIYGDSAVEAQLKELKPEVVRL